MVVDVPHMRALYRYIEQKNFEKAYRVAVRGVSEG